MSDQTGECKDEHEQGDDNPIDPSAQGAVDDGLDQLGVAHALG